VSGSLAAKRKSFNPFYVLLVLVGLLFCMTAIGQWVLMVRSGRLGPQDLKESPIMRLMDQHGMMLLLAELAVLGVATVGAITTEDFWRRNDEKPKSTDGPAVEDKPQPTSDPRR
jgi:hypothetical protein